MSYEDRDIDFSVNLPVIKCNSCSEKFVLMTVRDCAEKGIDNITYYQSKAKHCPYCGNNTNL